MPRRKERYWLTPFGRWISTYAEGQGVPALLRDLSSAGEPIHVNTVYRWLSGTTYVRPAIALRLVELGGGAISLDVIYGQRDALRRAETPRSEAG